MLPADRRIRSLASAVVAVALVAGLGACSGGAGDEVIPQAELESSVATQLGEAVDQPEPDIACNEDLPAEVGAETDCVLSVEGDESSYGVHIVVESLEDGVATYDIQVSDEPLH